MTRLILSVLALSLFGQSAIAQNQPSWVEIARSADGEVVVSVRPSSLREYKPNGRRSRRWSVYTRTAYKGLSIERGIVRTLSHYQANCPNGTLSMISYSAYQSDGRQVSKIPTMNSPVSVDEGTISEAIFNYACSRDQ